MLKSYRFKFLASTRTLRESKNCHLSLYNNSQQMKERGDLYSALPPFLTFFHFVKSKPPPNNPLKYIPATHIVEALDPKSDNLKAIFYLLCWKCGWFHCLRAHKVWTWVLKEHTTCSVEPEGKHFSNEVN